MYPAPTTPDRPGRRRWRPRTSTWAIGRGNSRRIRSDAEHAPAERRQPVDAGEFDQCAESLPLARRRVYEAVSAVVCDDHNYERGVQAAQAITHKVLAESGPAALAEMVVELSSKLAEAAGRIAAEQGVAATDIVDVLLFVD